MEKIKHEGSGVQPPICNLHQVLLRCRISCKPYLLTSEYCLNKSEPQKKSVPVGYFL